MDGVRLLTDPVLGRRVLHLRRRTELGVEPLRDVTAALVSHVHYDHLDRRSLRSLRPRVVVVPRGARRSLRSFPDVREVDVGDEVRLGDVTVRATHAEHPSRRWLWSTPSLGFVISGSRQVYFAGDTDLFPGMAELAGRVDVALLPVAGWGSKVGAGHLDPERAARAVHLIEPRIAVPIHWGTFSPPRRSASDRPPEEFRRLVAARSPHVEVQLLQPGAAFGF
jgi:L-ascorbate metabolism protein UlaG (beta-lactamase superfamily)